MELYNTQFLHQIGASLGTMPKIDKTTSVHSRGKFARICVELDLSNPLISHIEIRGYHLNIEYEGLHQICFSCGRYGHKADRCQPLVQHPTAPAEEKEGSTTHQGSQAVVSGSEHNVVREGTPVQELAKNGPPGASKQVDEDSEVPPPGYGPWMVPKRTQRRKPSKKILENAMTDSRVRSPQGGSGNDSVQE